MRIELNIQDYKHLEKFRESIKGNNPIKESIRPNNHSCFIDINCKELCLALNAIGITPKKSLILEIIMEKIPKELRRHFIRGYFDGDGSLNNYQRKNSNYIEWELSFISSEKFLRQILNELERQRNLYSCGNNYRFCFKAKQDINEVIDYLYTDATVYLDRKYDKVLQFKALNDYQVATL